MQFKLFQFTALVIASLALVNAVPVADGEVVEFNPDMAKAEGATIINDGDDEASTAQSYVGYAWQGPNRTGRRGIINVNAVPSRCAVVNSIWDNSITSILVKSNVYCNFYQNNRCSGYYVRVSGDYAPNLGGTWHDDAISSIRCYSYKK